MTVLGHVQRGGTPTPRDRVLATRYGLKAADLVHEGRFGRMAALQGDAIVDVSLEEATRELKTVPPEWYAVAQAFAGLGAGGTSSMWLSTTASATSNSFRPLRCDWARSISNALRSSIAWRAIMIPFARSITARRANAPSRLGTRRSA